MFDEKEIWQIKVALKDRIEYLEKTLEMVRGDVTETSIKMYEDNIESANSVLRKILNISTELDANGICY